MPLSAWMLIVLPCLYTAAASDTSCSATAMDGEAAAGECNAPAPQTAEQQAFIQTKKLQLQKVQRHNAAPQDDSEDEWFEEDEPAMLAAYYPEAAAFAALQTSSLLQELKVVLTDSEEKASISFSSAGQSHEYQLHAVSSYTEKANISIWTGGKWEYMHPGKPRTFRSTEDGKYASARINEDGSISGLFERPDGHVLDIRPLHKDDTEDPAHPLLLEYEGHDQAHVFSFVTDLIQIRVHGQEPNTTVTDTTTVHMPTEEEEFADTTTVQLPGHDDEEHSVPHPKVGDSPHPPSAFNRDKPWGGKPWFPGCYKDDDKLHDMAVGFAIPPYVFRGGANNRYPTVEKAKARWEEILAKATYVYEKQMNFRLKLGDVKVAMQGGPKWALTRCRNDGWDGVQDMINAVKESVIAGELPFQASWHGFVNCFGEYGVMGLGYVGTACKHRQGVNTGSDKFHSPASWITYTHELGHNFAGKHTFELGQGKTGGIMDYGDGKLDGVYQFNTRFRRQEMCKFFRDIETCKSFTVHGAPPPPPPNERPPCQWKKHPGKYSGGHAAGISKVMNLQDAQALCVELGKMECAAVTCRKGRVSSCTVRASQQLKPGNEDSYTTDDYMCCAKDCKQGTPSTGAPAGSSGDDGDCNWKEYKYTTAGGFAGGDRTEYPSVYKAKKKCLELGESVCKAVTCLDVGTALLETQEGEAVGQPEDLDGMMTRLEKKFEKIQEQVDKFGKTLGSLPPPPPPSPPPPPPPSPPSPPPPPPRTITVGGGAKCYVRESKSLATRKANELTYILQDYGCKMN